MGRELWAELSAVISLVDQHFFDNPDFEHPTRLIVRCHLWSVLHDRPASWACRASNWDRSTRPIVLPSQPTISRRVRSPEFEMFMGELESRLRHLPRMATVFKRLDAKALPVAAHSKDPDAGWGRGAGQMSNGYKLHALWAGGAMPLLWRVAALDTSEQEIARRMLRDLAVLDLPGHVVADASYDINLLYEQAAQSGNRLLAPRKRPGTNLGHRPHSCHRVRSIEMLEGITATLSDMGPAMTRQRVQIERDLGNLTSFGGGLQDLPAWVRRHRRTRRWVWGKLMVNAARIRIAHRCKSRSDE